ncbi:hypothetical protein [uncultured Kordia sp.]|nr:hypothetical protein [uncultured Kordia sp.]
MKIQQNITQFNQFQISTNLLSKINGGEKKARATSDEEIELGG